VILDCHGNPLVPQVGFLGGMRRDRTIKEADDFLVDCAAQARAGDDEAREAIEWCEIEPAAKAQQIWRWVDAQVALSPDQIVSGIEAILNGQEP